MGGSSSKKRRISEFPYTEPPPFTSQPNQSTLSINSGAHPWDSSHVKMPFSKRNTVARMKDGFPHELNRWDMIVGELMQPLDNSHQLQYAIMYYNKPYQGVWDFEALHEFFRSPTGQHYYPYQTSLGELGALACNLPKLCSQPIPLLKKGHQKSVVLRQDVIASLLANAFFCTFPRRNARAQNSEYSSFPSINFNSLFQREDGRRLQRKIQKLKCLLYYFERIRKKMPQGKVTFERLVCNHFPNWSASSRELTKLHVYQTGTIEDHGKKMLQVDFANKFVGGGVLGSGCVQEEILFLICPELIISRLFTEELDNNEALLVTGFERFSDYQGYSDTFRWSGNHQDSTERDRDNNLSSTMVMMDATHFNSYHEQFYDKALLREVNKAYTGFSGREFNAQVAKRPVATGNWGCGAFKGDQKLKALLQIIAAAEAGRDVHYFTFGDYELCNLKQMHGLLIQNRTTVGELWRLITKYGKLVTSSRHERPVDLFAYIQTNLNGGTARVAVPQPTYSLGPVQQPYVRQAWEGQDRHTRQHNGAVIQIPATAYGQSDLIRSQVHIPHNTDANHLVQSTSQNYSRNYPSPYGQGQQATKPYEPRQSVPRPHSQEQSIVRPRPKSSQPQIMMPYISLQNPSGKTTDV